VHPEDFDSATAAVFPDLTTWNRDVFSAAASEINAASFTWYFPGSLGRVLRDTPSDAVQMATASDLFGAELDRVAADLDAVGASDVRLLVGEWGRQVKFPEILISDTQRLYDGLFFAGCFNRMIERAHRMAGAHLSMLVNTIGPIQTVGDRHYVTAAYLVSQLYRWSCRTEQAPVAVASDTIAVPPFEDANGTYIVAKARGTRRAAILDAAATVDHSGTTLYLINRSMTEPITVSVTGVKPTDANAQFRYVAADSPYSSNTLDAPNKLRIAELPVTIKHGTAELTIPPCTAGALLVGPLAGALVST
jgi:alpha-L-arabinofuranosidase